MLSNFSILVHFDYSFSKAARGRPEGPTEQSVFKIFFVMLAVFQLRIRQKYKEKNVT